MTKQMLEELVEALQKKNKSLLIALIVIVALFIGMTIFAFSSFEVSCETNTEYEFSQEAGTEGDNSQIQQEIDLSGKENQLDTICGTIIGCVFILTVGGIVIFYGARKSKGNNTKNKENNN